MSVQMELVIEPDRIVFITISVLLFFIYSLGGIVVLLYTPRPLHFLAYLFFTNIVLSSLTWKKFFCRKLKLSEHKVTVLSGEKQIAEYNISEVKAITIGMHTVFYLTNGKRYVVFYCQLIPKNIWDVNPEWPCFKYNGDLRFRIFEHIVSGMFFLLFVFCFITNTKLTYTLCIIAICGIFRLFVFYINRLFFD